MDIGKQIYTLATELYPINRSITGEGVRKTLKILQREVPELKVFEVPSGTKCFDWEIPLEWNVKDAYIIAPKGEKICEFKKHNLHLLGYSEPVNKEVSLEELQKHLYSLPEQPDAIPYITSYYTRRWGFCLTENDRQKLQHGTYKVFIDSELKEGSLTYGEVILEGKSKKEIFLSTYICHPSMANNELSGPTVTTYLIKYLKALSNREYTYRIVFIPETIGSITYLSQHHKQMKKNIIAGFNITCVGDHHDYSYLPSRYGATLSDKVAKHILSHKATSFKKYSFLDRGSDERQYCAPGIDLPLCSVMRTKYLHYPQYHTSLDDLDFISKEGLEGAYNIYAAIIELLEKNHIYQTSTLCEPQLGKRKMYPTISSKDSRAQVELMMNFWTYCDGTNTLLDIAEILSIPAWELYDVAELFYTNKLLVRKNDEL
ncbi:MAG: DUF4910 domain-containing protein [Campylobacterota bacterium]